MVVIAVAKNGINDLRASVAAAEEAAANVLGRIDRDVADMIVIAIAKNGINDLRGGIAHK